MTKDFDKARYLAPLIASFLILNLYACSLTGVAWDSQFYIVKPQDTLYSIAWRYSLDYRQVAAWNGIAIPYTIYPGQKLFLSESASRKQSTTLVSVPEPSRPASYPRKEVADKVTPIQEEPISAWQWPTQGTLKKKFAGSKSTSQGIDIAGSVGQAVNAAANGRVVYSGEGLIGYGKLVIIKHNETYLSAYAHNRRLLVREGEQVRMGQKIAEMGSPHGQNDQFAQLHFEIRKLGAPVDPMKYLPRL